MFLGLTENFGTIGLLVMIVIFLFPYLLVKYNGVYKSEEKIKREMEKYNFIGSFKMKISGVYGIRWIKEVRSIIEKNRSCYAVIDSKNKLITVYYEENINQQSIRNLLIKIGYLVEIVK